MSGTALAILALVVGWLLLHRKTSRPDGDLIEGLHPVRRMMGYIMPNRNESLVLFDTEVDVAALLGYVDEANKVFHVDVTHCLVGAGMIGLSENPHMNRFAVGRRLYQRKGTSMTFSMKRKRLDREAKMSTVKIHLEPGESFRQLCERIQGRIEVERSDTRTYQDKEFDLFGLVPRPVLRAGVSLLKTLDYYNVLPGSFIHNDPLYTSMFCANLGSLNMAPGYHHLFEWGTCPLFMMVGKIEERPYVKDGELTVRRVLPIRWTYDERIDDGLNARFGIESVKRALENPHEYLGCLKADGSDARPLDSDAK